MYLVLWNERASKQSKSWVGKVLREPYFSGYVTPLWAPNSSPLVNRHTFNGRICLPLFVFAPADILVGTLFRTATVVLLFTNLLSLYISRWWQVMINAWRWYSCTQHTKLVLVYREDTIVKVIARRQVIRESNLKQTFLTCHWLLTLTYKINK